MFKKFYCVIVSLMLLFNCSSALAMTSLEKGVVDLLNSDSYLIQYKFLSQVTNTNNHLVKKSNKYNKENPMVITIAKINDNYYSNTEGFYGKQKMVSTSIYKDGKSYLFGESKLTGQKNKNIMMQYDNYAKSFFDMGLNKFKSYLTAFISDNNDAISNVSMLMDSAVGGVDVFLSDGVGTNSMAMLGNGRSFVTEKCNVFSKVGMEVIAGKKLDFVEYKSDNNALNPAVCRYYFLNGVLVKYIKIDKEQTFNIDGEKHGTGGYTVVDVLQFTRDVNTELFELPKGAKIIENKFTNRGLY